MKRKLLALASCVFTIVLSYGQQVRNCATTDNLAELSAKDPSIIEKMEAIETYTAQKLLNNYSAKIDGEIITIPVVVHVIYNTSIQNISDAQIQSQMDVINEDFRRTNSDANNTWSQAADTQIQFALATVDPNGNSTTGITRTFTSVSAFETSGNPMKFSSSGGVDAWDTSEYLNMWVCPLEGGLLGYAQFPAGGDADTDGVVMGTQYFGSSDKGTGFYLSAPFDKGRTTTHEIGHFLNLRHIWGDGACGVDDFVDDTPLSDAANYGCVESHTSCGSLDMVQNYMDYTDDSCMNLFTQGQKDRMRAVLETGGFRRSLALSDKFGDGTTEPPVASGCSNTIDSFPYNQSFESGDGWTQSSSDDGNWINDASGTPSSGTGPSSAADGSYYMFLEASTNGSTGQIGANATAILESPCFDLSGQSLATFSFENHMYGSNMGSLVLQVSTNEGSSWSTLWSQSGDQGDQWNSESVSLDAYLGDTIQLRFLGTTGTGWASDMAIDNLELYTSGGGGATDTSAPTTPSNLSASSITETTATISWSASSDNVGVTAYYVYSGSTYLGQVTSTSADLTGLNAGSTYTYAVSAVDAAGNESATNSVTFTTTDSSSGGGGGGSDLSYCGSGGSDSSYEWIDYVAFGGFTNSTGDDGGYADYTNISASVAPGSSYTLAFSTGFSSSPYTEFWKVWIDYDQNGSFDDDEVVVDGSSSSADNLSRDVVIPATATLGATTMRVSMKYNAEQTACETFDYGEVEDYTVIISNSARTIENTIVAKQLGYETVLDIVAYPNPAYDTFSLKLNGRDASLQSYRVINLSGKTVLSGTGITDNINISNLASGLYLIEVFDGQKRLMTKLIKE